MRPPAIPKEIGDASTFAQAIVDTIREPLLVLDHELRVLVASRSFYSAFHVDPQETVGKQLYELGQGEWDIPALRALLERVAPEDGIVEGYEVEREFASIGLRVMLLNARKVFYETHNTSTILVAIEDITERRTAERERDDLLAQKAMLLEEMQHRVANSLQIIASILLLKARSVSSEETRAHLQDAHKRVLAVAAVQRHLQAAAGPDAIQLEHYFVELCRSLAGAMIHDDVVQLRVEAVNGSTSSANAVSLGLVVTELVINALKHAFPVGQPGHAIVVSYVDSEGEWTLTVADNGVGKAVPGEAKKKGGLGTSLVSALAEQLSASVSTTSGPEGTRISLHHIRAVQALVA